MLIKLNYFFRHSVFFIVFMASLGHLAHSSQTLTEQQALDVGVEAYIYGYPLIITEITRKVMTNTVDIDLNGNNIYAPQNRLMSSKIYPTPEFTEVVSPNTDTLYSVAWLNLSKEPYVLSLPDEKGRYYLFPLLDAWTDVFAVPGTRTTGTKAQQYVITGPGWKGTLPNDMKELKSPTNIAWIAGRTYSSGTPEDYKKVYALQEQYTLIPLSSYGKPYTPPLGKIDPTVDMNTPITQQVNHMDASTYFKMMATLMKENPPSQQDSLMVKKLAQIGIIPGQDFDINNVNPIIFKALQQAPKVALEKIEAHAKGAGFNVNGWNFLLNIGKSGTDYLQRAYIASVLFGANLSQDAIYMHTAVDQDGRPLTGTNDYIIHFLKGQQPPVDGFWSLTLYNKKHFLIKNPLNRYSINSRSQLTENKDGSLDLNLQHTSPGQEKEANWLPTPEGEFNLILRLYWPKEAALNRSWKAPVITRIK